MTLLRFLKREGVSDAHLAQKTLGSIMNSFGVRLADVGVAKKGGKGTMMKPYNPAIFPVLLRLVENVGLISMKRNMVGLLPLTKDEEKLVDEIKYDYFLWTNHRERLILASLLDVLYQQNVTDIVCPYIEREVLEVLDGMTLLRGKEIRVITRSTETIRGRERAVKKTIDALKFLEEKGCKFEARENRESPIHAKLATSNSCALVSSSNLTLTSLKRNYEIGMAFFAAERIVEVGRMFENIWCDPQTKEISL